MLSFPDFASFASFYWRQDTKSLSFLEKPGAVRFSASSLSYDSTEAAIDKSLDIQGLVISIKEMQHSDTAPISLFLVDWFSFVSGGPC